MKKKKTWREKVNEVKYKIRKITSEWEEKLGKGKILIPNALDIERLINETKKGELLMIASAKNWQKKKMFT